MKMHPNNDRLTAIRGSLQFIASAMVVLITIASVRADEPLSYNRDIRPILSDKCFFCHGPDDEERQADLRLDIEEMAKEHAIVPGKPNESDFIDRILSTDPDEQMPPADSGKSLTKEELQLLRKWVADGAEYEPFWAYVPPRKHTVPEIEVPLNGPLKSTNWIDQFIADRLDRESLSMAPEADARTLIRRISFDLTGLPPESKFVEKFAANPNDAALEEYVDQLLASDHYGERMAAYWLDLVRFADTVGYHGDQEHSISPYRDWVLDAFNDNMPFDQFTREQLAGDLLPDATVDQQIATGYNRMLQTSHEGGVQPAEYLAIYSADRVRNLSSVWMGATMGCCQCHNHKYDPYSIKDFYSMAAFFADVDEAQHFKVGSNALPSNRPPEITILSKRERQQLESIIDQIAKLDADNKEDAQQLKELNAEKERLEKSKRRTMVTVSIEPRPMRLLPRGDWLDDSGPVMVPAVPEFMGRVPTDDRATRLDLANWLTDPEQGTGGLTARVQVNRYWYLLFGTGLARDLDDFGGQGEAPVYPELLDQLAIEFIAHAWDVKHMMKLIVMSRAYRQSSAASDELLARDPYNQLFAHQSSYRLPAEMVRDQALAVSGLLNRKYGGPSAKPYQPAGYYRHLNFPTRKYASAKNDDQWRRGVYMHWQRQFLHPMLKAMDAPSREECTAQRARSNTPLAALVLMNDPTFVEAARAFAVRIIKNGGNTDAERIDFAFREALSRPADENEQRVLTDFLEQERKSLNENEDQATSLLKVGIYKTPDDIPATEIAAWTSVTRILFNLSETITRN